MLVKLLLTAACLAWAAPATAQIRAPAQDECPQGREIRAKKQFPPAMTDCEVLDADMSRINSRHTIVKAPTVETPQGPSYDCSKALKPVEKLICSDKQLAELEWLVSGAFKKALDNQIDKTALIAEQQQFNIARNNCPKEFPTEVRACVQQLLGSRAMYLSTLWKKETTIATPVDLPLVQLSQKQPSNDGPVVFNDKLKPDIGPKSVEHIVILVAILAVYFFPTLTAYSRGHHNRGAIGVLNFMLGWTFLGWVAALVWAFTQPASAGVDGPGRTEPRLR